MNKFKIEMFFKKQKGIKGIKKFDKFENSNKEIFLHYNKNFKTPKCHKKNIKCSCFHLRKELTFHFEAPLSYVHISKKNLRQLMSETEKHNNLDVLNFNTEANLIKRDLFKNSVTYHRKTLLLFKAFVNSRKDKRKGGHISYVENQMSKCNDLVSETVPWQLNDLIPIIIFKISLYCHYHTLNLFENFVNKTN